MTTGPLLALSGAAALAFLSGALGRRVRRLRCRLESLDRPLHELRGALASLELGLSFVERSREVRRELNGCADSLHVSLDRAALAARDIGILRVGRAAVVDVKVELDFRKLVLRSARAWSFLAASYAGSVEVDWRAGPVRVLGHSDRLQQALDNLIANALEHGGSRVLIEVSAANRAFASSFQTVARGCRKTWTPYSPKRIPRRRLRAQTIRHEATGWQSRAR
jgi:signal transduction histidine kinase